MKLAFGLHKRIGLRPSFGVELANYGPAGKTLIFRLWWAAATVSFYRSAS